MDRLTLNSYAKVNLYLEVLKKRKDNYHNIKTVFERIDLADKIILKSRRDKKISVICNNPSVPQGDSNLAAVSARLLQDKFNINKGVDIKIIKRIPVGSGMGGGSSNAACVLMGLNKLWNIGISQDKLAGLGGEIGSDVPFFVYNTPFAKGTSRGDKIEPLKAIAGARLWHILVVPKVHVSTPLIYKKWDEYAKTFKLTRPKHNVKILILALSKNDLCLAGEALFNSLEQVTIKLYPQIGRIKEKLIQLGAKSVLMSGSGSALFGVVSSRKEALSLSNQLGTNSFCQAFVTRTR